MRGVLGPFTCGFGLGQFVSVRWMQQRLGRGPACGRGGCGGCGGSGKRGSSGPGVSGSRRQRRGIGRRGLGGRGRTAAAIAAATAAAGGGGVAESASVWRCGRGGGRAQGHERGGVVNQWIARVIGHAAARGAISGRREAGGRGAQLSRHHHVFTCLRNFCSPVLEEATEVPRKHPYRPTAPGEFHINLCAM